MRRATRLPNCGPHRLPPAQPLTPSPHLPWFCSRRTWTRSFLLERTARRERWRPIFWAQERATTAPVWPGCSAWRRRCAMPKSVRIARFSSQPMWARRVRATCAACATCFKRNPTPAEFEPPSHWREPASESWLTRLWAAGGCALPSVDQVGTPGRTRGAPTRS